jgi:hypothetical protein
MDLEDEANGKPQNFTYSLFLLRQQVDATFAYTHLKLFL